MKAYGRPIDLKFDFVQFFRKTRVRFCPCSAEHPVSLTLSLSHACAAAMAAAAVVVAVVAVLVLVTAAAVAALLRWWRWCCSKICNYTLS